MTDFLRDAVSNFRRANAALSDQMTAEDVHDAVLYFAFGVERVCKAILVGVNPLFILEVDKFDNALGVLYADLLIPSTRETVSKELQKRDGTYKRNLLPFLGCLRRAASFSSVIHANLGTLTKLSDLRGVVAHRLLSELDLDDCRRFLAEHFVRVVESLANEQGFDAADCLGSDRSRAAQLRSPLGHPQQGESLAALLTAHRHIWDHRKGNSRHISRAKRETDAAMERDRFSERSPFSSACPACENACLLYVEPDWDVEGSGGPAYVTGIYVSSLECYYCGLLIADLEDVDHLKLNDRLRHEELAEE